MLSSVIVERLRSYFIEHHKGSKIPVLCVYFNHKEQNTQTFYNVIASLLKQLITYDKPASCSDDLVESYKAKLPSRFDRNEVEAAFESEILQHEKWALEILSPEEHANSSSQSRPPCRCSRRGV